MASCVPETTSPELNSGPVAPGLTARALAHAPLFFRRVFGSDGLTDAQRATLARDTTELFVSISFFLHAGASPRCAHEALAKQIFDFHTRDLCPGVDYTAARSGIEWWVQRREAPKAGAGADANAGADAGAGADDDAPADIGFHFDKDEDLVDEEGLNRHPAVATITYLSDTGAPTIIVAHRTAERYGAEVCGPVAAAWAVYPQVGAHVAFDGRWLHGVPAALAADEVPQTRLTLLANVWLDHVPRNVDPLPDAAVAELVLAPADALPQLALASCEHDAEAHVVRLAAEDTLARFAMGPTGREFALLLGLPVEAMRAQRRHSDSRLFRIVAPEDSTSDAAVAVAAAGAILPVAEAGASIELIVATLAETASATAKATAVQTAAEVVVEARAEAAAAAVEAVGDARAHGAARTASEKVTANATSVPAVPVRAPGTIGAVIACAPARVARKRKRVTTRGRPTATAGSTKRAKTAARSAPHD